MDDRLTAGEFQGLTGLSAKALQLYAEREVLTPAAIDPVSGYRLYDRDQLQHGMVVDVLRHAQVPLPELAAARDFDFDDWRGRVAVQRVMEDFYVDTAEQILAFDPEQFVARSTPAAALDWIGVVVDLELPAGPRDDEGRIETFIGLTSTVPAAETAFAAALRDAGVEPAATGWTTTDEARSADGRERMLVARPGPAHLGDAEHARLAEQVRRACGTAVRVVSGTLPDRTELTFTAATVIEPGSPTEAAEAYLRELAFENHRARHGLTALRPSSRAVVDGPFVFDDALRPTTVFDVQRSE